MSVRLASLASLASLACLLAALGGCHLGGSAPSQVSIVSDGDSPARVNNRFRHAWYSHDPQAETSFFLTDAPPEALISGDVQYAQVLHIALLWRPRAGKTPMDTAATNLSIRYIVIADGEVGIYGGGGFGTSSGDAGDEDLLLRIRQSSLRLLESTDGFVDRLPLCRVEGAFSAESDPQTVRKIRLALSQTVTNALGRTRLVGR